MSLGAGRKEIFHEYGKILSSLARDYSILALFIAVHFVFGKQNQVRGARIQGKTDKYTIFLEFLLSMNMAGAIRL